MQNQNSIIFCGVEIAPSFKGKPSGLNLLTRLQADRKWLRELSVADWIAG